MYFQLKRTKEKSHKKDKDKSEQKTSVKMWYTEEILVSCEINKTVNT